MKSRLVIILCIAMAASPAMAGEKKELKTQKDKVSYAIGLDIGNSLKKNELDVDPDVPVSYTHLTLPTTERV